MCRKTVFFSGLAVLVGFSSIGFAKFQLYQSAVSVAVGVGILLIALVTIVPFLCLFSENLYSGHLKEKTFGTRKVKCGNGLGVFHLKAAHQLRVSRSYYGTSYSDVRRHPVL